MEFPKWNPPTVLYNHLAVAKYGSMMKYLIGVIPGAHHNMYKSQNYNNQELKCPNGIKEQGL
eukprot:9297969-Ditylum_brightwellii.AAC.1